MWLSQHNSMGSLQVPVTVLHNDGQSTECRDMITLQLPVEASLRDLKAALQHHLAFQTLGGSLVAPMSCLRGC